MSKHRLPAGWDRRLIEEYGKDVVASPGQTLVPDRPDGTLQSGAPTLYIGRGSIWGNPYRISTTQNRQEVVRLYIYRLNAMPRPELVEMLRPIATHLRHGGKLRCFCAPLLCHGMVLAKLARMHPELQYIWEGEEVIG